MTAVSLVLLEHNSTGNPVIQEHSIDGVSYSPVGEVEGITYNTEVREHPLGAVADVAAISALCNDAKVVGIDSNDEREDEKVVDAAGNTKKATTTSLANKNKKKKKTSDTEKPYQRIGEPTEAALCVLAEKLGGMSHFLEGGHLDRKGLHLNVPPSVLASANVDSWRESHPRLATLEFSRDRKSMSVLCDFQKGYYPSTTDLRAGVKSRKAGNRLLVKGAPNLLLERCTHVKFRDGTVSKLTADLRRSLEEKIASMAARPLRCLALAVKDYGDLDESLKDFHPQDERDIGKHPLLYDPSNYKNIESGLTFVGVVGIKDPARPEVAESIKQCTKAGIRVMMITGDAIDTAVAIAKDVHIFPSESDGKPLKAFQGREFFQKPLREQLEILKEDNIVFCRAGTFIFAYYGLVLILSIFQLISDSPR